MSSNKVRGLFKGLKYISQIFESEKEQEIQIGLPTDVKHVAHIGWDGPSANSPSWMNEFKTIPGVASDLNGDIQKKGPDNSVKWASEDVLNIDSRRNSRYKEKSDKARKKSSSKNSQPKDSSDGSQLNRQQVATDLVLGSHVRSIPEIPKKSRRKKLKDNLGGSGSSKLRAKVRTTNPDLDFGLPSESESKVRNKQRLFEDSEQYEREASRI